MVVIAGGSYFAGHRIRAGALRRRRRPSSACHVDLESSRTRSPRRASFRRACISPKIEGRPDIENVQFVDARAGDDQIGARFDITLARDRHRAARPTRAWCACCRYVLENEDQLGAVALARHRLGARRRTPTRQRRSGDRQRAGQRAAQRRAPGRAHQGRRDAEDAAADAASASSTRDALIEALKSDPESGGAHQGRRGAGQAGPQRRAARRRRRVDMLRQKASQDDENLYVRVKAAEALSNIKP